jgi:hypothetical protein
MTKKMREWKQTKWKEADQKARKLWGAGQRDEAKEWYAKADALKAELQEATKK